MCVKEKNYTVRDVLHELLKLGLTDIVLNTDNDGFLYYDLNTQAKSHLYLYEDFSVKGRYGHSIKLEVGTLHGCVENLYHEFEGCLYGRDHYNTQWKELGVAIGLLSKVQHVSYSYE